MDRQRERSASLVVWADYVCPYSYLADVPLRQLREEGIAIEQRAFELRPDPVALPDAYAVALRRAFAETVLPLAQGLGVEIRFPERIPRSGKAHEAAMHARDKGVFPALHAALYRAYWVDGLDIGRIDVLVSIGETVGLDRTELKVVLDIDTHTSRVGADTAAALDAGVTGVPAFSSAHGMLMGLQPLGVLRQLARGASNGDE